MARGLNKVTLIGRVGNDPELKATQGNVNVCTFNLATDESYKDQQGNKVEKTEWHRIVAWRKLAEISGAYVKKGSLIYLEGKLSTRSWEKDGQKHYITEIIASDLNILSSVRDGQSGGAPYTPAEKTTTNAYQARPQAQQASSGHQNPPPPAFDVPNEDFGDDLPF